MALLATGIGAVVAADLPRHLEHQDRSPRDGTRFWWAFALFVAAMVGLACVQDLVLLGVLLGPDHRRVTGPDRVRPPGARLARRLRALGPGCTTTRSSVSWKVALLAAPGDGGADAGVDVSTLGGAVTEATGGRTALSQVGGLARGMPCCVLALASVAPADIALGVAVAAGHWPSPVERRATRAPARCARCRLCFPSSAPCSSMSRR